MSEAVNCFAKLFVSVGILAWEVIAIGGFLTEGLKVQWLISRAFYQEFSTYKSYANVRTHTSSFLP